MGRYLNRIPRALPDNGDVIVHNHVRPAPTIGERGFRIWRQSLSEEPDMVVCDCAWAPHLKTHYRVKRTVEKLAALAEAAEMTDEQTAGYLLLLLTECLYNKA